MGNGGPAQSRPYKLFCPQCNAVIGWFNTKAAAENYKDGHARKGHKHATIRKR